MPFYPFVQILVVLLLTLSLVGAAPFRNLDHRALVTLPLRAVKARNTTTHPLLHHQLRAIGALRRVASMTGEGDLDHEDTQSSLRETIETLGNFDALAKRSNEEAVELPMLLGMTLVGPSLEDVMGDGDDSGKQLKSRQLGRPGRPRQRPGATPAVTPPISNSGVSVKKVDATKGGITKAGKPTSPNSIGLDIEANDRGYLASVQIGTGSANLLVDTGSANLWIKKPSTAPASGPFFQVAYLTGQYIQGNLVTQPVNVASLRLPRYTFGIATEFQGFERLPDINGVMGLARTIGRARFQNPTLIEALLASNQVRQGITAYKISRVENGVNDGEITFGGFDTTKFIANTAVTLTNINQASLWEVTMMNAIVGGKRQLLEPRRAVIDTGSTFVIAPMKDAIAIHKQIPQAFYYNNGIFYVPCTTTANVQIALGGRTFPINPKDLAHEPIDATQPAGYCLSGIMGNIRTGLGGNQWILGDVFLKNVYFWTDIVRNQVGFAQLRPLSPTAPGLG